MIFSKQAFEPLQQVDTKFPTNSCQRLSKCQTEQSVAQFTCSWKEENKRMQLDCFPISIFISLFVKLQASGLHCYVSNHAGVNDIPSFAKRKILLVLQDDIFRVLQKKIPYLIFDFSRL